MRCNWLCLGCVLLLLVGCRAIPEPAKQALAKPVACGSAQQDIDALEANRASGAVRFVHGVTAIFPVAAVIAILTGNEGDKVRVASGAYNTSIDEKQDKIRKECGLAAP